MMLLLLACALLVPPPRVAGRMPRDGPRRGPRTPRDGPRPATPDPLSLSADIDLYAACLDAGLTPAAAAQALVDAGRDPATRDTWRTVAALLAIGVPPERAWATAAGTPGLEDLGTLARMSGRSGSSMADAVRRLSAGLRTDAAARATARAERAGVLIALPLTICFLPAFLVLGLAPVVISLGTQLLST